MARLASQEKMEYYPTPEGEITKALDKIKFTVPVRAFDPCAGDGRTLKIIKEKFNAEVYGVEMDVERSEQTEAVTGEGNCLKQTDFLVDARVTAQSFNLIFNNPPYDWERGYGNTRLEHSFIDKVATNLVEDGIMVLVIPEAIFESFYRAEETLKVILKHYAILEGVKMLEDETFKQWIIILKKAKSLPLISLSSGMSEWINTYKGESTMEYAIDNKNYEKFWEQAVRLSQELRPKFKHNFNVDAEPKPLSIFKSVSITEEMLHAAMELNNKGISMALEAIKPMDTIETLLPLRNSHLPLLLPTGHLNGRIEGTNLVINGQVERYIESWEEEEEKEDKNGKKQKIKTLKEINKFRAKLSVLDLLTKEIIEIN